MTTVRASDEPINPDVESYCWAADGWENAAWGSVQDARAKTRGKAAAFYASETGCAWTEVHVWKRYVRPLTRAEGWEYGFDRWANCNDVELEDAPDDPPPNWEPDEYIPVWQFISRDHPEAIPVWICGTDAAPPPH